MAGNGPSQSPHCWHNRISQTMSEWTARVWQRKDSWTDRLTTNDQRLPAVFLAGYQDQIRGKLTFSIEFGLNSAWTRNAGRSRSDFEAEYSVNGAMSRSRSQQSCRRSGNG